MPTYRYRCAKCGEEMEIWQSFDEKPKTRHTGGCGGKLQKVMSAAGIVLKGPGFYKTDNRSSKSGAKSGANGKESSGSESTSSESTSKRDSSSGESSSSSSSSGSSGSKETASSSSSSSS